MINMLIHFGVGIFRFFPRCQAGCWIQAGDLVDGPDPGSLGSAPGGDGEHVCGDGFFDWEFKPRSTPDATHVWNIDLQNWTIFVGDEWREM